VLRGVLSLALGNREQGRKLCMKLCVMCETGAGRKGSGAAQGQCEGRPHQAALGIKERGLELVHGLAQHRHSHNQDGAKQ
jgi:hypothetical protein